MEETKKKFLDDDLMEIFKASRILQKSHSKLMKTSQTQHKGLQKMSELLKLAGESNQKHNEMQRQTDKLIAQQKNIIENLISVKQENKLLKEQLQAQEENCVVLQKELEVEKEDVNEKIREINEINEEKIEKIIAANLEKEFKMKNDWTEIQKNWEITKKQYEERLDNEKKNIAALNAEKNEVIKATIKKYEEQLKTLRESLENAKHEQEVLEKRNLENIKIHEKKMEDLEKHYIKMMEDVSKELKSTTNDSHSNKASNNHSSLVGASNNHSNSAETSSNYSNSVGTSSNHSNTAGTLNNHQNLAGTSKNYSNLAGNPNKPSTVNIGLSKFNQTPSFKTPNIEDANKQGNSVQIGGKHCGNSMNHREENKLVPNTTHLAPKQGLMQIATKPTNSHYCHKNPVDNQQRQIKPILTSLSQFTNENQGGNKAWNTGAAQTAVKKMKPLQSFPEEASGGSCHPLYAAKQNKVTFAPNLTSSAKETDAGRRVQFPSNKRKLN